MKNKNKKNYEKKLKLKVKEEKAKRKSKNKKAFEIQFNWIFILFAGALILLLFTSIIIKQKKQTEESILIDLTTKLDTLFVNARSSIGTSYVIDVPKEEVIFDCDSWHIAKSELSQDISKVPLFSPRKIKSNKLITFALSYNIPFKLTDFLYLTTNNMQYIFFYNDSNPYSVELKEIINETMPDNINYFFANVSAYNTLPSTNLKHKIILLNVERYSLGNLEVPKQFERDKELKAILIKPNQIKFYNKVRTESGYYYFQYLGDDKGLFSWTSKAELFAAIFANDEAIYSCNIKKAYQNLDNIKQIYIDEINKIFPLTTSVCKSILLELNTTINDLTYSNVDVKYNELQDIKERLQLNSCPLLY